jgi:type III secretion system FlhB-like substrate exporter
MSNAAMKRTLNRAVPATKHEVTPAKAMEFHQAQAKAQQVLADGYGEAALRVYNEMRSKEAIICDTLDTELTSYNYQQKFFTALAE